MRRTFIAGNWKMNLNREEAISLARELVDAAQDIKSVELAVCPPSVYLDAVGSVLQGSAIGLGAQNMYHEGSGAFTGELCASMMLDVKCRYVILGHSERRHILGETDPEINLKVKAALEAGLTPILCVGEKLDEREGGKTQDVVAGQVAGSLDGISSDQVQKIVIAYEPVWAIGTGKVATPEQAEQVHADLRKLLENRYNAAAADVVRIQYGGSVKPENANLLLSQNNIDGALVGGASLKTDSFIGIATAISDRA